MARSPHGGEQLFGVAEGDVLRDPPVAQVQDAVARGNRALHVVRDHEDDAALVRGIESPCAKQSYYAHGMRIGDGALMAGFAIASILIVVG